MKFCVLAVRSGDVASPDLQIFRTDGETPRRRRNENATRFRDAARSRCHSCSTD